MTGVHRDLIYDHVVRPLRDDDRIIFRAMEQGDGYREVALRVGDEYRRYARQQIRRARGRERDLEFPDRYYKLRWNRPGSTIVAHISKDGYKFIHPDQDPPRTLSVREAARVQGFPDDFRFAGHRTSRLRQIGNAVPPLLARALAEPVAALVELLRSRSIEDWRAPARVNGWQPSIPRLLASWDSPPPAPDSQEPVAAGGA